MRQELRNGWTLRLGPPTHGAASAAMKLPSARRARGRGSHRRARRHIAFPAIASHPKRCVG